MRQSNQRIQDVEKLAKLFESEKKELQVTLEEAEAKLERALADVSAAKDETKRRLAEKDEAFETQW